MQATRHQPKVLRDYLAVVRRYKWRLILTVLLVLGATMAFTLRQAAIYQSQAEVLLTAADQPPTSTANGFAISGASRAPTEVQVITSSQVRQLVFQSLKYLPNVAVAEVGQTDLISISAQSSSSAEAARIANTYASSYIQYRKQQATNSNNLAIKQFQAEVDSINKQIAAETAAHPAGAVVDPSSTVRLQLLYTQVGDYQQKIDSLNIYASTITGGAEITTQATPSSTPIKPTPVRNGLLGFAVGLVLGVAIAFMSDHLDDSLESIDDLERASGRLPVLGIIPALGRASRGEQTVTVRDRANSAVAEAYRGLRSSILFVPLDEPLKTLQITSATAGEGKTTTVANLGLLLAQAGKKVVIVSCDLRRPRLHELFGLSNEVGVVSVIRGETPLANVLQQVPGEKNLVLLASGPSPSNPSEILASKRFGQLLKALSENTDLVLVDCAPLLAVTDAVVTAVEVDATLLIAKAGSTTSKQVTRSIELLRNVRAPIIGTVLVGAGANASYGYGYGYYAQADNDGLANIGSNGSNGSKVSNGIRRGRDNTADERRRSKRPSSPREPVGRD